jgi:hypothetical protein
MEAPWQQWSTEGIVSGWAGSFWAGRTHYHGQDAHCPILKAMLRFIISLVFFWLDLKKNDSGKRGAFCAIGCFLIQFPGYSPGGSKTFDSQMCCCCSEKSREETECRSLRCDLSVTLPNHCDLVRSISYPFMDVYLEQIIVIVQIKNGRNNKCLTILFCFEKCQNYTILSACDNRCTHFVVIC